MVYEAMDLMSISKWLLLFILVLVPATLPSLISNQRKPAVFFLRFESHFRAVYRQ